LALDGSTLSDPPPTWITNFIGWSDDIGAPCWSSRYSGYHGVKNSYHDYIEI
jgi:hypothetical protein